MGKKRALAVWESNDAPRRSRGKKRPDDGSEIVKQKRLSGWSEEQDTAMENAALREEFEKGGCALIVLILILLTFAGAPAKEWFPS
jgi:hypothetical protein